MSVMAKEKVEPELFSVAQAADFMGISESTVRAMLRRGELKRLDIGGCLRIRKEDIKALIDARWREAGVID